MNSNKSISILGCGWLGFELAKHLIGQGFHVKGSTTSSKKLEVLRNAGIQEFNINLSNPIEEINQAFFHSDILVLNIPPGRRNPQILNAYPHRIEMSLSLAKNNGISNAILISSTGVYRSDKSSESVPKFPVYDCHPPNGVTTSAQALIAGEKKLRKYFPKKGTLLRFGGLVGGERKAGKFLAGKKDLKNGAAPVNMIHRYDCIHIIHQIIAQEKWGKDFNAVADEHPSRAAFYTEQAKKYNFDSPSFIASADAEGKIIDNTRIKSALNYTFKYPNPMQF